MYLNLMQGAAVATLCAALAELIGASCVTGNTVSKQFGCQRMSSSHSWLACAECVDKD